MFVSSPRKPKRIAFTMLVVFLGACLLLNSFYFTRSSHMLVRASENVASEAMTQTPTDSFLPQTQIHSVPILSPKENEIPCQQADKQTPQTKQKTSKITCWDAEAFGNVKFPQVDYSISSFFLNRTTRSCERARINQGDEGSFLPFLRKLDAKECVSIVIFGGSITTGAFAQAGGNATHAPCIECAFPARLIDALNIHFPCITSSANDTSTSIGKHQVYNLGLAGAGSSYHFDVLQSKSDPLVEAALPIADLIIMEAAVNDASKIITTQTEALLQAFKLRAPGVPLMYVEVSSRGWNVEKEHTHARPPYHSEAARDHLWVLEHYNVMQLDIVRMLGPFGSIVKANIIRGGYVIDTSHPGMYGHAMIASVISYTIRQLVSQIAEIEQEKVLTDALKDDHVTPFLVLPGGWKMLPARKTIDFTKNANVEKFTTNVPGEGIQVGWSWDTDLPNKPKTLMTNEVGACVKINLDISEPIKALGMIVLKSWLNFGKFRLQLKCAEDDKDQPGMLLKSATVTSAWVSHTSQRAPTYQKLDDKNAQITCPKVLYLCHDKAKHGKTSKLKLFSITLY